MKSEKEKVPGFDEIIFENRNKEYGAFDLRKRYPAATCFSLLGVIAISFALVIILSFTLEKEPKPKTIEGIFIIVQPEPYLLEPARTKQPEPEILKPEIIRQANLAPQIVEKVDSTDVGMASNASLDSMQNAPVEAIVVPGKNSGPVVPVDEPLPSVIVEEMPTFPGGTEALLNLIARSIKYPEDAASNGIQGRVTVKFVVSSDGSVKQVVVIGRVHPSLDEEAVRVVSALPKWRPGKQNGIAVPVFYTIPVNFKLKFN